MSSKKETIHTIHEFAEYLKKNSELKKEFESEPIKFLNTISMPSDTKSAIADMAYFMNDVMKRENNANKASTKPLDLNENDDVRKKDDTKVVFNEKPTLHSVTRKDCHYGLIGRKTEEDTIVDISDLKYTVIPSVYESSTSVKAHLEWVLKAGLSAELSAAVTSGAFSASATASMSAEAIKQHVETYLQTVTIKLVHYQIVVTGSLHIKTRLTITQNWAWVGKDCPTPIPPAESLTHTVEGDPITINIGTVFHVWEYFTESEGIQIKKEDALKDAKSQLKLKLQHTKALPEPPFPTNVDYPLNF